MPIVRQWGTDELGRRAVLPGVLATGRRSAETAYIVATMPGDARNRQTACICHRQRKGTCKGDSAGIDATGLACLSRWAVCGEGFRYDSRFPRPLRYQTSHAAVPGDYQTDGGQIRQEQADVRAAGICCDGRGRYRLDCRGRAGILWRDLTDLVARKASRTTAGQSGCFLRDEFSRLLPTERSNEQCG